MKTTILVFLLIFGAKITFAQDPYLYISSYDKKQLFYICNGEQAMTEIPVQYVLYNLSKPSKYLNVDSLFFICDSVTFDLPEQGAKNFDVGLVSISNFGYRPSKIGDDTARIKAYYGGKFISEALITCHARESPRIAFYGASMIWDTLVGGFAVGVTSEVLTKDTLHDIFSGPKFQVSDTAVNPNSYNKNTITVRSCGSRIIDSIYTVGDFTDITIKDIPQLPYTMNGTDTLQMFYKFIPTKIGKSHHYLVIHSTDGDYIVWSFEYEVKANNSVTTFASDTRAMSVYPNPASHIIRIELPSHETGLHLMEITDEMGKKIVQKDISTDAFLDISAVASGRYFLTVYDRNGNKHTEKITVQH